MAHTQHGDPDKKKRSNKCAPNVLVSTGPWIRCQWATIGGTTFPCRPWPGNPPFGDPVQVPQATPDPPSGRCWWSINSGTFPFNPSFQIFIYWGEDFGLTPNWYAQMLYTSDGSIIPAGSYESDFIGPSTDDPTGTYTQSTAYQPLCPTANPSTIAVSILP